MTEENKALVCSLLVVFLAILCAMFNKPGFVMVFLYLAWMSYDTWRLANAG